jgi:hypothetical protein
MPEHKMSKLSGYYGGGRKPDFGNKSAIIVFSMAFLALLIVGVILAAVIYSFFLANPGQNTVESETEIIPETTTTTSTTTTSTTTTSTTSTTTSTTTTTTTTSTTTTTLSDYQIAACMASKIDKLYLRSFGPISPSQRLEDYLGEYLLMFPQVDCGLDEYRSQCDDEIREYAANDQLWLGDNQISNIGYPTIIWGGRANIIPSVQEFEKILECGSLK